MKKKKTESVAAKFARERMELAPDLLKVAPWNPRGKIAEASVADLAASIRTLGVIQPLVAMKDGKGYTLVAGHRRLVAARLAGLATVPVDVLDVDEQTAKRITFIENLQRKDADPLLESKLVGGLVKSGMTQDEIAAETGRGREWVARRLNLSRLSKSWRKRVKDGEQITTDCLEHVAAYPEGVQEKLKKATRYNGSGALRWCDIEGQFSRETQDLKKAVFDRTPCKTCPNNTGCSPELFDWDGKPATFGKCLDSKCYKRKVEEAVKATIADAKAAGATVKESESHPDYSIDLQSKPDKKHDTLYVWKDYNGEPQMQWGEAPKQGKSAGGGMSDEEKELRRLKMAANKARRKLAEWCDVNLAGVIAANYVVDVQIALAFQRVFDIGCEWRVFGSQTNAADAELAFLLDTDANDPAPMEQWASLAASEIAAKIVKPEVGARYAKLLIAILPPVASALTDEERQLVASDEEVLKLREPIKVRWTSLPTDDEGEDEETDETEADDE